VPAYVIFSDASLREMARAAPNSEAAFRQIPGVGEQKLKSFGAVFVAEITDYVRDSGAGVDNA